MTIIRRLAVGYALMAALCLGLVMWLGYREFVEEPREFAALGLSDVHNDTGAEVSTLAFLTAVPLLLGLGWWWTRRVLKPLRTLSEAVEAIDLPHRPMPLSGTGRGDEVDRLATVFNSMTQRLDESFRRIQEFTLHASHELKTPLTVMRAHLETALRECPPEAIAQTAWIDDQLDEIQRLTRIVDSLTLLTKADAGLVELQFQPIRLFELVEEAFEDAEVLAQPAGLAVRLEPCAGAPIVQADRHRLRQLLLILTDNAVKYSRPGGRIVLSLHAENAHAVIRITNQIAAPLAPEALPALFERFARGENARGRVEGCGLGLSLARWIVAAHGGTLELKTPAADQIVAEVMLPQAPEPCPVGSRKQDNPGQKLCSQSKVLSLR